MGCDAAGRRPLPPSQLRSAQQSRQQAPRRAALRRAVRVDAWRRKTCTRRGEGRGAAAAIPLRAAATAAKYCCCCCLEKKQQAWGCGHLPAAPPCLPGRPCSTASLPSDAPPHQGPSCKTIRTICSRLNHPATTQQPPSNTYCTLICESNKLWWCEATYRASSRSQWNSSTRSSPCATSVLGRLTACTAGRGGREGRVSRTQGSRVRCSAWGLRLGCTAAPALSSK